ncbi:MAG: hypothetical protein ACFFAO_16285 [Candidatus Hermodarchaeota archaeon]
MTNSSKKKFIGTLSQKELLKLYQKHVNGPKVLIFKGFGFGVIPGEREGVKFRTLAGRKPSDPPMEIYNCRSSGGVFNLGHHNPQIVQELKDALDGGLDVGDHMLLSEWRALLGKKLADLMPPGITKTTFGVSGDKSEYSDLP